MDLRLLRIDSRLIHGQVATNWVAHVGASTIIAVNDSAAQDNLRKTLLLQVAPSNTKSFVLSVAKAGRVYKNPKYADLSVLMVVESPRDVVRLLDEGIEAKDVNVGGITFKAGNTLISEAVSVSDEDIAAFQELDKRGVKLGIQQLPTNPTVDLMDRLRSKKLI